MISLIFGELMEIAQEQICGGGKSVFAGNIGYTQQLFREVDGVTAPFWHKEQGVYPPNYWGQVTADYADVYGPR